MLEFIVVAWGRAGFAAVVNFRIVGHIFPGPIGLISHLGFAVSILGVVGVSMPEKMLVAVINWNGGLFLLCWASSSLLLGRCISYEYELE
jgi:hypothetical protein